VSGHEWRHGRRRPPWWPENEPFPPADWGRRRVRFQRRFAVFAFIAFLLFATVLAVIVSVFVQIFTALFGGPPHPIVYAIFGLFLLFTLTAGTRSASRIAGPLGDLIEAAEGIERGDYSAPVRGRCARSRARSTR
jgi:hypothetical protein